MRKMRIAVVAGGISSEREISLKTGEQVFSSLSVLAKYQVSFLEISRSGKWEWRTSPGKRSKKIWSGDFPDKDIFRKKADLFFIGLHGAFGEDGRIQALFDWIGVKYTGSGIAASALSMDKFKCSEFLSHLGMPVPKMMKLKSQDPVLVASTLKKSKMTLPLVVKPNDGGSSVGVTIVKKWQQLGLALDEAFRESDEVVAQQFIPGREFSCGVLGNAGCDRVALPAVEIVTHGAEFFDYHTKYFSKDTEEICPAPLGKKETRELERLAKLAHGELGCDGLTRSDFILNGRDGKFYFLEINTLPGLTAASICPKEARAAEMSFEGFLDEIVRMGLIRNTRLY